MRSPRCISRDQQANWVLRFPAERQDDVLVDTEETSQRGQLAATAIGQTQYPLNAGIKWCERQGGGGEYQPSNAGTLGIVIVSIDRLDGEYVRAGLLQKKEAALEIEFV